jgi:hypothetical protein
MQPSKPIYWSGVRRMTGSEITGGDRGPREGFVNGRGRRRALQVAMATLLSAVPTLAFTVASAPAAHAQEAPPDPGPIWCGVFPDTPGCTADTTPPPPDTTTTPTTAPETTTPTTEPPTTTPTSTDPPTTATTAPPTTATTDPPTTATTQPPTTTTERPTTSTTSRTQTGGSTSTTDGPGTGSTGSTGGGGGHHTVVTTPPPNNGFWGILAGLANSNRAVTRGKNAKLTLIAPVVTPSSEAAKPKKSSKQEATATTEDGGTKVANAADPQALSLENTRAETHDRAMPRNIRIALIALAALVLVTLLLVPRVPALLFTRGLDEDGYAKRRQKRRSVATISVGGPRPKG